uniref:DUF4585 domain-containing protein n=1 Tax=Periophthalmus magnuspinnatus TaxID=409849 RepID=A0A3B4AE92_9GOBI
MDSWTLQGDSYSFLRSAPRTFSLCHRDGTPNHVEIFDIINTPSQRSAISETTCLCDIFGDDCEASLSSSPASAAFIPQQTEVEGRAVTSPSVDDNNDSSGSYHTAHSSIEGEEGLEDTNEKQNCVPLQSLTEEQTPPEFSGTTNRAHCRASPDLTTVCDGILPENKTPQTHSPEGSCHSLSSSLVDITYTPSPSSSRKGISETESRRTTPASKDRHSSLSQHTPTPELENCVSSSASVTTQPEVWELSSEPGHICNHNFTKLPPDNVITPLNFQPKVIVSSTDILLSPRPALRGRISVHDLFSRDTNDTESTPDLQYTSPSPVNSPTPSPEPGSISSEIIRLNSPSPSPSRLSPTSPHSPATRSPTAALSPQQKYIYTPPPSRSSLYSPVLTHLSPSPVYSPIVCIDKASSPEIRITASSPELENELKSPVFGPQLDSPVVQSPVPPHITNVSPVVQSPTPSRITNISPVDQSPTPSHITNVSPVIQSPTPHHITNISPVVQSLTPSPITNISPVAQSPTISHITNISPVAQSPTPSPITNISPVAQSPTPTNISPVAQSPTPRHITNISPVVQSPTPRHITNISPVVQSPTPRPITNISPVVQSLTPSPITNISPVVQSLTPSPITNISPVVQSLTPSPITNISPVVQSLTPSPITNISPVVQSLTPSPITNISPVVQSLTPSPITNISPVVQSLTPSPITNISPVVQSLTPSPITNISPVVQSPTPCHITNITNIVQPPASPHITNISYSIVQPEDQPSPAFSEEPCLSESPIPRDFSPSRYSSHSSLVFDLQSHRYQPSSRPPPCSCTAGCPSHPHPHNSPHNLTPPAPTHSPGHYPVAQPALRPHHCRPDPQPVAYQPSSPKASPLGPGPPQGLYQPLHQPPACPPHPSLMHAYSAERPLPPAQHMDPRRPPVHRSPQQSAAVMPGAPYPDPAHSHSPGLSHMDPHYLCAPQTLGPSYGSDYGGDSSSLYSESNYGQTPRRVLMDPETGKYFYIEVPVQPLRKMLFDPETGQYVEVLIPQQAMSHSGLYPPSAPNYPPLHNTNMYAPAPQYMPYAAPPAQPQPPRYPEPSAVPPMHPHGPGVGYRNAPGQGPKSETQGHPPVDPNYLESMYYVPTGMNASPNPTPPDYYHKHPSNLPPTGGKRS